MDPSEHESLAVEIATVRSDVRWLRKAVIALGIIVLSPKLGGPDAPSTFAAIAHHVHHVV
jgi:hypothetical protein